jgi:hypothetical protein
VLLDQTQQSGQWVLLLTTNFNAGTNGNMCIRNTGTTAYVVADAAEWVEVDTVPTVNLWATDASASRFGPHAGSFTVSRTSTNAPLTIYFNCGGTAVNGPDYVSIVSSITLLTGVASTNITIMPSINSLPVGDKTAMFSLVPNAAYSIGNLTNASVTIHDVPINAWEFQYFEANVTNSAIAGDTANPAGDGIPNLMKYALGLDPTRVEKLPLTASIDTNNYFAVFYTRPDPPPADILYQVDTSSNLLSWTSNLLSAMVEQIAFSSNYATATITWRDMVIASAASQKFLRLRVSRR